MADGVAEVPFWLVWSPQGTRPPRYEHYSEAAACNEAARLARENPGKKFFAIRPVARFEVPAAPMNIVRFTTDDDGVPF